MLLRSISSSEHAYIRNGCEHGIRSDGRGEKDWNYDFSLQILNFCTGHDEFRSITIENDIFPHTNASVRLKVHNGVEIICSINVPLLSVPIMIINSPFYF
jgi:exosome complex RNA-binding protein Rrp42 (RNase PH superfamily)